MTAVRVFLDAQALQSQTSANRGIARYAFEVIRALSRRHPEVVSAITLNPAFDPKTPVPADMYFARRYEWNSAGVFRSHRFAAIAHTGFDLLYHALSPFEQVHPVESMLPRHAMRSSVPLLVTLYDLIPLRFPDVYLPTAVHRRSYRRRLQILRHADLVLTISEHSRREALEELDLDPEQVVVVGCGASEFFCPARPDADRNSTALVTLGERPFVLAVTGDDPRKNAVGLLDAWAALAGDVRAEFRLVVAGRVRPPVLDAWIAHALDRGLTPSDDVVFTGFVDDATLRELYRRCALFVCPSRAEGFGLPALEAARCGAPVVTSSATALPEILDHPPATFPPDAPEAIAAIIDRGLRDLEFRAELHAAGARAAQRHTWEAVADRIRAAYDAVARTPALDWAFPGPLRIALIGPFGSSAQAGDNESWALAEALATELEVHCVCCDAVVPPGKPELRRFPVSALGRVLNPAGYDAIVAFDEARDVLMPEEHRWVSLWLARGVPDARERVLEHVHRGHGIPAVRPVLRSGWAEHTAPTSPVR